MGTMSDGPVAGVRVDDPERDNPAAEGPHGAGAVPSGTCGDELYPGVVCERERGHEGKCAMRGVSWYAENHGRFGVRVDDPPTDAKRWERVRATFDEAIRMAAPPEILRARQGVAALRSWAESSEEKPDELNREGCEFVLRMTSESADALAPAAARSSVCVDDPPTDAVPE